MIIVTGANGFIGSVLVGQVNSLFPQVPVVAVDSVAPSLRPGLLENKKTQRFLLKDEIWSFLETAEAQKQVTWILHMGANSSTTEKNWEHLYENNTLYTQRLFEWCAQHKKNFIYASSAATYGAGELGYDDHTDSDKLKPLNLYGESKVLLDRWALKQSQTPPQWYGLKFFNVFGPNESHKESMASLVYKAYFQILENGSMNLFKSYLPEYKHGEQKRDFVYVKDVTSWIGHLMKSKAANGLYNMGYGQCRTWVDLANSVFKAMNKPARIEFVEMPDSIRDQYQYFTEAKMQKLQAQGLPPAQWPLEKAVEDYVVNYLIPGRSGKNVFL